MKFRCSATYAHNNERCQRTGDKDAIRLFVYEPGVHLGFCDDHFGDREKYRPVTSTAVQEASAVVATVLSGQASLRLVCRDCGLFQENRAKCECGSRDLEPVAEKVSRMPEVGENG